MSRAAALSARPMRIAVKSTASEVSALLVRPRKARWVYVMGHGAGAGMNHPFMDEISSRLAQRGIATLRYQFPYMEAGRKRPDPPGPLMATARAAMAAAERLRVPIVVGGKSMGGRMTSLALAEARLPVHGLVFLGFPLHAAKKPGSARGEHLAAITAPMLFVQGARDALADLALMRRLCSTLGTRATLHVVEGGDHSFDVLRRSGRTRDQVLGEIADAVAAWGERVLGARR